MPDDSAGRLAQPVSLLTVAVVVGCVPYCNRLHTPFVRGHGRRSTAGRRAQPMLSQIKFHFPYSVLNMTEELCDSRPETAKAAIGMCSRYPRECMESIGKTGVIPFRTEPNHTMLYVQIGPLRSGDALTDIRIRKH